MARSAVILEPCHCVRENVSAGVLKLCKVEGKNSIVDLLAKPLDRSTFMEHIINILWLNSRLMRLQNDVFKRSISLYWVIGLQVTSLYDA
jgi:hypothetical protein